MINAPYTGAVIRFDKIDTPDYFGATRVTKDGAAALPTAQPHGLTWGRRWPELSVKPGP